MVPSNRDEFTNYCLRKLGEPVIQVNVAVEQVQDRVDEALFRFYERHFNGTEEHVVLYVLSELDVARGYIEMPDDTVGVTDVMRLDSLQTMATGSVEYQQFVNDVYGKLYNPSTVGGLAFYYMSRSYLSLIKNLLKSDREYTFNPRTNKLIITGGAAATYHTDGCVVIRFYKKLHGEESFESVETEDNDSDNVRPIYNIWAEKWLQDYATALIRKQWAQNLSKYNNMQLIGGVGLNGDQMLEQANLDIEKLEEQLRLEYEQPPRFFMG